MRVPNLENLIQQVEQQLSEAPVTTNPHEHRSAILRRLMVYDRAQHLLNSNRSWKIYLTRDEVLSLGQEAANLGGGATAIGPHLIEKYGPPSMLDNKECYGITGLNQVINTIRTEIQIQYNEAVIKQDLRG